MSKSSTAGAIINSSPRPRLLVSGFDGQDELVERILALCPTSKKVGSFREVRQAEWDVLVTTDPLFLSIQYAGTYRVEPHVSIIYVANGNGYYTTVETRSNWDGQVVNGGRKVSQEIRRVRGLPERVSTLVHEKLEPVLIAREVHNTFSIMHNARGDNQDLDLPTIEPFITTPDGDILAGRYKRSENSEAWLLPHDAPDLEEWVKSALAEWNALSPDRFPGVPDWSRQPKWMTAGERQLVSRIAEVNEKKRKAISDFESEERESSKVDLLPFRSVPMNLSAPSLLLSRMSLRRR
ncbi:hypothetical protein ACFXP3_19180 [Streptomyces sp. NPDC059096]|uniref:hypothetical protein n=1 Tax=Streptomyces sp. NPDC059096 TaxID=3346727 RepID=UPI0036B92DA3